MVSTDADMQLVRTHDDGSVNLAVGEPFILHEHLPFAQASAPGGPYLYPQSRGEPELIHELERRHHGMHVVVGNGAKQMLSAAFAAYRDVYGRSYVWTPAPYWPSYPYLARQEFQHGFNLDLGSLPLPATCYVPVKVLTSPNNPDGEEFSDYDCDIWDAAYASPVFGFTRPPRTWGVAVYSAAKLLGLSGLRIGWAVTANAGLAEAMAVYVERFTSGACVSAQRHVAYALRHLRVHDDHTFFDAARAELLRNAEHVKTFLGSSCSVLGGVPSHGKGMFAFVRVKDNLQTAFASALTRARVKVVPGSAFGLTSGDAGWYRINIGHHERVVHDALKSVSEAMGELH